MQKTLSISVKEFALLITRIKQQSSSLVELVLDVFGGKLHPDGKFCVILCCWMSYVSAVFFKLFGTCHLTCCTHVAGRFKSAFRSYIVINRNFVLVQTLFSKMLNVSASLAIWAMGQCWSLIISLSPAKANTETLYTGYFFRNFFFVYDCSVDCKESLCPFVDTAPSFEQIGQSITSLLMDSAGGSTADDEALTSAALSAEYQQISTWCWVNIRVCRYAVLYYSIWLCWFKLWLHFILCN